MERYRAQAGLGVTVRVCRRPFVASLIWLCWAAIGAAQEAFESADMTPSAEAMHALVSAAVMPTDRTTETAEGPLADTGLSSAGMSPDVARWLRPQWGLVAEWEPEADGVEILNFDADVTIPTYPVWGPPPPLISFGFSYTDLIAPAEFDLPPSLYDFTLGASWMRRIHDQWMLRVMLGAAFASDLNNTSSEAWQIRGGLFAVYDWRPEVQFLFGAVATGREDLPVLPGLGVLWRPSPSWHVNLMMPRPRVSYLVLDRGERQHWVYVAAGLSGGTWAAETQGLDDRFTYREWRAGIGWEWGPPKSMSPMPGRGVKFETELDYVFGRTFEFEYRSDQIDVSNSLLLRTGVWF